MRINPSFVPTGETSALWQQATFRRPGATRSSVRYFTGFTVLKDLMPILLKENEWERPPAVRPVEVRLRESLPTKAILLVGGKVVRICSIEIVWGKNWLEMIDRIRREDFFLLPSSLENLIRRMKRMRRRNDPIRPAFYPQ